MHYLAMNNEIQTQLIAVINYLYFNGGNFHARSQMISSSEVGDVPMPTTLPRAHPALQPSFIGGGDVGCCGCS